jgi:hypothetical protein
MIAKVPNEMPQNQGCREESIFSKRGMIGKMASIHRTRSKRNLKRYAAELGERKLDTIYQVKIHTLANSLLEKTPG